jgi:aspartyl aminopeptidase
MEYDREKRETRQLKKKLFFRPKLVWDALAPAEEEKVWSLSKEYRTFLDGSKTERESCRFITAAAEREGFTTKSLKKGDRGKLIPYRGKVLALYIPGKRPPIEGVNIVVSHIDAPRLDLKSNPLYEETSLAYLKTHYYGGIKKFQWVTIPLAIHGKIIRRDGSEFEICLGEEHDEPVFTIPDLLPHLSKKIQQNKKINDAITGEKLNILSGSIPFPDRNARDRVKLQIMNLLHDTYHIVEEDFTSAELEIVPAWKSSDVGFDRSLIGGYGQDDRICAFASCRAIVEVVNPEITSLALFMDKEEIGSEGNTGAKSRFIAEVVRDILRETGYSGTESELRATLYRSRCLSGDVTAGFNPDYADVHEKRNAAKIGYGVCVTKFTGILGKAGSSDASSEYYASIRRLFNSRKIRWQSGELGKVDEGGGGTIAKFMALHGTDVIDCGPPLLGMHSPFEVASKMDLYMTYRAYLEFFRNYTPD